MSISHKHHIVPKHSGGTDEDDNLILLSDSIPDGWYKGRVTARGYNNSF
jgi:hypothetical protein